jgi:hypothetical protein
LSFSRAPVLLLLLDFSFLSDVHRSPSFVLLFFYWLFFCSSIIHRELHQQSHLTPIVAHNIITHHYNQSTGVLDARKKFKHGSIIMSEGGLYPWKRQQLRVPKTANYKDIQEPISLPKDKAWCRDPQTREWSVVDLEHQTDGVNVAVAIPVAEPMDQDKKVHKDGGRSEADIDIYEATIVKTDDYSKEEHNPISHAVLSTDTFQGICIRYSITPTELRKFNKFSGSNLALAPSTLIIPHDHCGKKKQPQLLTPEQKKLQQVQTFLKAFRKKRDEDTGMMVFETKEAVAYLEISDWNVDEAIQDARNDYGWEKGDSFSETNSLL